MECFDKIPAHLHRKFGCCSEPRSFFDSVHLILLFQENAEPFALTKLGSSWGRYGHSVAVDGDFVVIGAPLSQRVYIYKWNETSISWNELFRLNGSPGSCAEFGSSVAISGSHFLVGAPYDGNVGAGSVSFFDLGSATPGTYVKKVESGYDGWFGTKFGWHVNIDGGTAIVGASSSALNVFHRDENAVGGWSFGPKITLPADSSCGWIFGCPFAISGNHIIVGSPHTTIGGVYSAGKAYIYQLNNMSNIWGLEAELTLANAAGNDLFGLSVDIHGDFAVVGSEDIDGRDGSATSNVGGVALYRLDGEGTWNIISEWINNAGSANDNFGSSVAVNENFIAIGARGVDSDTGKVFIYQKNLTDSTWNEIGSDMTGENASDEFGYAVGISKGRIIVGAPENGGDSYVVDLPEETASPTPSPSLIRDPKSKSGKTRGRKLDAEMIRGKSSFSG